VESLTRVAIGTAGASQQHHEAPTEFYQRVLAGISSIGAAILIARRQPHPELGCGRGSLSLWMATNYPEITAVSTSRTSEE
jgi:hypothetical protein